MNTCIAKEGSCSFPCSTSVLYICESACVYLCVCLFLCTWVPVSVYMCCMSWRDEGKGGIGEGWGLLGAGWLILLICFPLQLSVLFFFLFLFCLLVFFLSFFLPFFSYCGDSSYPYCCSDLSTYQVYMCNTSCNNLYLWTDVLPTITWR